MTRALLEDVLETLLVLLARLPAAAPALHRGRNRIRLAPGPIGELEEVRTGVGAAVDVRELHAVLLRRRWRRRTLLARAGGRGRRQERNAGRIHCPNTLLAAEDFNTRTAGAAGMPAPAQLLGCGRSRLSANGSWTAAKAPRRLAQCTDSWRRSQTLRCWVTC